MHHVCIARGPTRRRLYFTVLLLIAACFSGDGLAGQPCQSDKDCDPVADLFGATLRCKHDICGYMPSCGNGIADADEACDDGNQVDGDGCSKSCTDEVCGDGIQQPQESCDDGNRVCGDGCSEFCTHEICGDGVRQPQEACDDSNRLDDDACLNTCEIARCGDGVVRTGVEACDDGNPFNEDPCLDSCELNVCGDGVVDATREGCDDQNSDDNDGCDNGCQMGAEALGVGPAADHVCAIRGGALRCWGENKVGQLGYGSAANFGDEPGELPAMFDVPATKAGQEPPERVVEVRTGAFETCAIFDGGAVRCWGLNQWGQRGDEPGELPTPDISILDPVKDAGVKVLDVRVGYNHACALLSSGAVRCWGSSDEGKLGYPVPAEPNDKDPLENGDVELGGKATQIGVGHSHTCALLDDQTVRCWGSNGSGKLGYPNQDAVGDDEAPSVVGPVKVGGEAQAIAVGMQHTCAVLAGGVEVRCWGRGDEGALGTQSAANVGVTDHPADSGVVKMLRPGDRVAKIVAGGYHTCVLLETADVRCWGEGHDGQLGDEDQENIGDDPNDAAPDVVEVGGPVRDLVAGSGHTCALLGGGRVRCWGDSLAGQLGRNQTDDVGHAAGTMPPESALIYPNPAP